MGLRFGFLTLSVSAMISCVTGWGQLWAITDGFNWHPTTVNFGKKFAGKPQFMVAASAAGKKRYVSKPFNRLYIAILQLYFRPCYKGPKMNMIFLKRNVC